MAWGRRFPLRPAAPTLSEGGGSVSISTTDFDKCEVNPPATYRQLEDYAGHVVEKAAKVAETVAMRLVPVMHDLPPNGKCDSEPEPGWPPHFAEMRSLLQRIESYLDDITYHVSATGL
jgi:choline dehydrogenase-like flavoprotein